MKKMFYPKYWLDAVGFWNSHINTGDNVILFSTAGSMSAVEVSYGFVFFCFLLTVLLSMAGGMYLTKRVAAATGGATAAGGGATWFTPQNRQYVPIGQIDI